MDEPEQNNNGGFGDQHDSPAVGGQVSQTMSRFPGIKHWKPAVFVFLIILAAVGFYYANRVLTAEVETIKVENFSEKTQPKTSDLIAKPAPEFSLPSLNANQVMLRDNFGKKDTVVLFWTVWSSSSQDQMKILNDFDEPFAAAEV